MELNWIMDYNIFTSCMLVSTIIYVSFWLSIFWNGLVVITRHAHVRSAIKHSTLSVCRRRSSMIRNHFNR